MPTIIISDNLGNNPLRNKIELLVDSLNRGRLCPSGHTEINLEAGLHTARVRFEGRLYPVKRFRLEEFETLSCEFAVIGYWRREFQLRELRRIAPQCPAPRIIRDTQRFRFQHRQPSPY
jgi:hypothetical protein